MEVEIFLKKKKKQPSSASPCRPHPASCAEVGFKEQRDCPLPVVQGECSRWARLCHQLLVSHWLLARRPFPVLRNFLSFRSKPSRPSCYWERTGVGLGESVNTFFFKESSIFMRGPSGTESNARAHRALPSSLPSGPPPPGPGLWRGVSLPLQVV